MLKNPWSSLTLLLFLSATLSLCDVVELKTGDRLEGTFKQATPAGVVIEVGGQAISMPLAKVRAIYFGAAPTATLQPAVPNTKTSAAHEALQALKALRSATEVGCIYRDYLSRLADAKIKVNEYLESVEAHDFKSTDFNGQIKLAMQDYERAADNWKVMLGAGHDVLNLAVAPHWKAASDKIVEAEHWLPSVPSEPIPALIAH